MLKRLKDVLLERADENVLIVDWSGANRLPYTVAVANSRVVGAQIAHFIQTLYKSDAMSPESFHLIGHSLGAHIAGYAGERLRKLGRITGLDPAGPFFRNVAESVRLDPSDAVFVDVIHSDPGSNILQGLGTPEDCGDLDFYPAGGDPPGCDHSFARSVNEKMPTEALGQLFSCQHLRSYDFFIYSFNRKGCLYVGVECTSWEHFLAGHCNCGHQGEKCAIMGIFSPTYTVPKRDRRLYLKVAPDRPYCVHQYQVLLHIRSLSRLKTYGQESRYADVAIVGKLGKLKRRIHLRIRLSDEKQVEKILLSAAQPIGHAHSATVSLNRQSKHAPTDTNTIRYSDATVVIETLEINYLYPLPKNAISSKLCRRNEEQYKYSAKRFIFSSCH